MNDEDDDLSDHDNSDTDDEYDDPSYHDNGDTD